MSSSSHDHYDVAQSGIVKKAIPALAYLASRSAIRRAHRGTIAARSPTTIRGGYPAACSHLMPPSNQQAQHQGRRFLQAVTTALETEIITAVPSGTDRPATPNFPTRVTLRADRVSWQEPGWRHQGRRHRASQSGSCGTAIEAHQGQLSQAPSRRHHLRRRHARRHSCSADYAPTCQGDGAAA